MTKNFCDKCGTEVDDTYVRISFSGNTTTERLIFRNFYFCEKCYMKVDVVLKKSLEIPLRKKKAELLS